MQKIPDMHSTGSHPQSPPQHVGQAGLHLCQYELTQCQHQAWVSSAPAACLMSVSDCVVS